MVGLLSPWRKQPKYKGYRPASWNKKPQSKSGWGKKGSQPEPKPGFWDMLKAYWDYRDRQKNGRWMIFIDGKPEKAKRRFRNYDEFRQALEQDIAEGKIGPDVNVSVRRLDDVRQVYYGS